MVIFKRLFFALPLLFSFWFFLIQLNKLTQNPTFMLDLSSEVFSLTIYYILALLFTSMFFAIFVTLASDLKYLLPCLFLVCLSSLLFLPLNQALFFGGVLFLLLTGASFYLLNKLSTYYNFQASTLLSPAVKLTTFLLVLASSAAFYISVEPLAEKGFEVPQTLVDTALKFSGGDQLLNSQTNDLSNLTEASIPKEQLDYLKANPALLTEYGLDPAILETLDKPSATKVTGSDMAKGLINKQLNSFIEPYKTYIPIFLTGMFFITFTATSSMLMFIPSILIWATFKTLEKTGYITFTKEMREVKKMVV